VCTAKNKFYGACLNPSDRATRVNEEGWDGYEPACGEAPRETMK
jgi:hypothetical protein